MAIRLGITVTVWGGYFVVARKAVATTSPEALAFGRYFVGGVVLVVLVALRRQLRLGRRSDYAAVGFMAAMMAVFNIFGFVGMKHAPATDAAMIMPAMPTLFTAVVAAALLRERLTGRQLAGLLAALCGELLVFREQMLGGGAGGARLVGDLMFVGAAASWSGYTIVSKLLAGRVKPVVATAWAAGLTAVFTAPFGLAPAMSTVRGGVTSALLFQLAYLGLLQTVFTLIWWYDAVARIGATRAALVNTLVPVIAIAMAWLILGERLTGEQAVGAALVVLGVAVAAIFTGRRPSAAALAEAPAEP